MSNFSDYIKSNKSIEKIDHCVDKNNEDNVGMENQIIKYQNYSNEELLSEFIKETQKQKKLGGLNDEDIKELKNTISPYLNSEQKINLEKILSMVKDVK